MASQRSVNIPDVPTKYISNGCADKVSLASDGSLVSGSNLLPLVLTTFFLLIGNIFLHTWLGLWSVQCWSSYTRNKKEKHFIGLQMTPEPNVRLQVAGNPIELQLTTMARW